MSTIYMVSGRYLDLEELAIETVFIFIYGVLLSNVVVFSIV